MLNIRGFFREHDLSPRRHRQLTSALRRRRKQHRSLFRVLVLATAPLVLASLASGFPSTDDLDHKPLTTIRRGTPALITATARTPLEWAMVFWRPAGTDDFVSVKFEAGAHGTLAAKIETAGWTASRIEYYLAYKTEGGPGYLPVNVPDAFFECAVVGDPPPDDKPLPSEIPSGTASAAALPFSVRLDASLEKSIREKAGQPSSPDPSHTENLSLAYNKKMGDVTLDIQTRAAYSNRLQTGDGGFDLPDVRIAVSKNGHAFRAGDLQLSESEFATGTAGNRGLEYVFDNRTVYAHLFTAGTQQLRGFKGIGIPKTAASLFGGAAGFTLAKVVSVKAVYLTGQDDPSLAANAGFSGMFKKRAGDLIAIVGESRLFDNALNLSAEYAHSQYDQDTTDGTGKVGAGALRAGASLNLGFLDARIGYRDIARDFNTVAQPFFVNDRRRLEAGAGMTMKTLRLSGSLAVERNNTSDDPQVATSKNILTQLDLSWQFLANSGLRLGYGTSSQDARLNDNPVLQGNLLRTGLSAGLDIGISPRVRFTLSGQRDEIKSSDNPGVEGESLGGNLGLSVLVPDRLILAPMLGVSRTKNKFTGESTLMLMAFLNGELTLAARILTLNAAGSAVHYDLGSGGVTDSLNLDGGLNLHLKKWIRIGEAVISLRAAVIRSKVNGQDIKDARIFVKADISLGAGGFQ